MLFMILIGALLFANFVNYTTMPADLQELRHAVQCPAGAGDRRHLRHLHRARHCHGGAVDDPPHRAAVLSRCPALGYDPVWFGILVVIVVQIGMISPPVGMNIFVVKSLPSVTSQWHHLSGRHAFTFALVVLLALIVAFPALASWLPSFMR